MVRKRDLSDDERELWDHVTRDVRRARLRAASAATAEKKRAVRPAVRDVVAVKPPTPPLVPRAKPHGPGLAVDGATAERLRRGKVEPDATLDLHGMTQSQAFTRLLAFVRRGHEKGYRCLLVITGKGSDARADATERTRAFVMPERSKAGVLRSLLPLWLEQSETRAFVVGVQSAHQRHGGGGAYYVYLRRSRSRAD